jgi:hypothetical protein
MPAISCGWRAASSGFDAGSRRTCRLNPPRSPAEARAGGGVC